MYRLLVLLVLLCKSSVIWSLGGQEPLAGWEPYAQREALLPIMMKSPDTGTLKMISSGHLRCNGAWRKSVPVEPACYYFFSAEYVAENVTLPRRSVLVRIDWKDAEGNRLSLPEYPTTAPGAGEAGGLSGLFRSPPDAVTALIELIFRWDEKGSVSWSNVKWNPAAAPKPRKVVLATVNHRPRNTSGPEQSVKSFQQYVELAGQKGADIVCLPEGVSVIGTGLSYLEVAEPVPGPSTRILGRLAKRHKMYVVAGLYERDGDTVYNSSVLIDRNGEVVGLYRKVSLPRGEIDSGLTPGSEFPVFQTDFGTVGMMICWDSQFPEAARRLAAAGAEIILLPIWGGSEPLFPARAIENQVHLITSSFDAKSGIWNRRGELIAEAVDEDSIAVAEVDLSETIYWEWVGDLRAHIPRESPPVQEIRP